jgi:hypothetical protein
VYLKVGVPSEVASLLEEIGRESHHNNTLREIGDDPDLDHFMVITYFFY